MKDRGICSPAARILKELNGPEERMPEPDRRFAESEEGVRPRRNFRGTGGERIPDGEPCGPGDLSGSIKSRRRLDDS